MSSSTPPRPDRRHPDPDPSSPPDDITGRQDDIAGPHDDVAAWPFPPPTEEETVAEHFGVLIGYNDAQADVLSELAGVVGELTEAADRGQASPPIGSAATLAELVGTLRQLFVDERDYLAEERRGFAALAADETGPFRHRAARLEALCEARTEHLDHETYSLDTGDRLLSELRSAGPPSTVGPETQRTTDLATTARRLDRIVVDLTLDNEGQRVWLDAHERELLGPPGPERHRRTSAALLLSVVGQWIRRRLRHGRDL